MLYITQSNDTNILLNNLLKIYQEYQQDCEHIATKVFTPFTVIVPSMVLGDWLNKSIASRVGISTLFATQFWGQYQWQMIQKVLKIDAKMRPETALQVPEVAVLSGSVMRWRLFGFFSRMNQEQLNHALKDENNPLNFLLKDLFDDAQQNLPEQRIWQACEEISSVYVRYMTQRPEWLHAWSHDLPLPVSVEKMIADKDHFTARYNQDEATPEWLVIQYQQLEKMLRYLWRCLFAAVYQYRETLESRFWQILELPKNNPLKTQVMQVLPKQLYLFTVQQIPLIELQFLKRLSKQLDIYLLHFNQSKMFWADIVDKNWLATQIIIQPNSVYLKDSGHALLSRLGKESRETFAMLVDLSGGEFYYEKEPENIADLQSDEQEVWKVSWKDDFTDKFFQDGLLHQLKQDILMLDDAGGARAWLTHEIVQILQQKIKPKSTMILPQTSSLPSLAIHACHSLRRQLEIARLLIARYLNEKNSDGSTRKLSDVVVYLPDIDESKELIELIFDDSVGMDGLKLPAKITGVTNKRIEELMKSIIGFYALLGSQGSRFYKDEVYEWLLNPMLYHSFDLSFDEMMRACQLLDLAGFKRGFDEEHLAENFDEHDTDYRYTFSYALDRIVAGFLMPETSWTPNCLFYPFAWRENSFHEATLPLAGVSFADEKIIQALCRIHTALQRHRNQYLQVDLVQNWLDKIEKDIIDVYFTKLRQTPEMRAIFEAKNAIAASIRANRFYQKYQKNQENINNQILNNHHEIYLSLKFVLESVEKQLVSQAVSSEASGTITFARFGALRSIPFGLTLMLDMNLSAFPRQDKNARMDLMKAGLRRRGDRLVEDDDNGAFLDALLCSRDACFIFYNGESLDGSTQLLPASAVSELIEYLKFGVDWQACLPNMTHLAEDAQTITKLVAQLMPSLIEQYLITRHFAIGFAESVFYETQTVEKKSNESLEEKVKSELILHIQAQNKLQQLYLPPAPLYQQIREVLDNHEKLMPSEKITLPDIRQYHDIALAMQASFQETDYQSLQKLLESYQIAWPTALNLNQICRVINHPAAAFLRDKLAVLQDEEAEDFHEPRQLGALGRYELASVILEAMSDGKFDGVDLSTFSGVDEHLQIRPTNHSLSRLYYDKVLPAGVVRLEELDVVAQEIAKQSELFACQLAVQLSKEIPPHHYSKLITPVAERGFNLNLGESLQLKALLPSADESAWMMIVPSRLRAKHLLRVWIEHLAWQVYRGSTPEDVEKGVASSFCSFSDVGKDLSALGLAKVCMLQILPVQADIAEKLLGNFIAFYLLVQKLPIALTTQNAMIYQASHHDEQADWQKLLYRWLDEKYADYEDCSFQAYWRELIGSKDALRAFMDASVLIEPLYQYFGQCILPLNHDDDIKKENMA